jgi:hypothetical protein
MVNPIFARRARKMSLSSVLLKPFPEPKVEPIFAILVNGVINSDWANGGFDPNSSPKP